MYRAGFGSPVFLFEPMDIETVCNTSDDILFAHVEANSRREIPWVKSVEAHDGHAVIVGGGPSVLDWLHEIRYRKSVGQTIFALNGAAKLLHDNGIEADHQVIVDAREHNAAFLGYARHHLLASQVHPSLLDKAKGITLWHQEYPQDMARFDACLPANQPAHTLIGGGTTVGLSAMVLAYALGYRKLHLYGYDSSNREGATHAYLQSDPQRVECIATVAGRKFRTSLAMAKQAELFPQLADSLIDLGCLITIRGDGLLPWTSQHSRPMTEAEKYRAIWERPEYRQVSPGLECVDGFLEIANPQGRIIDFGCGTGRAGLKLAAAGLDVLLLDFADNCRDPEALALPFSVADLRQPMEFRADWGFCTDVMEHIEPQHVDAVIRNVMGSAPKCFFQISLIPDALGKLIGQELHLSVHPMAWWQETFTRLGYRVEWAQDRGIAAVFIISTT
jgi:uncharacterized Rossmann fold enzyme/SAM-dependent methyltransferase